MAKPSRAKRAALKTQGKCPANPNKRLPGKGLRLAKCPPGPRMNEYPTTSATDDTRPTTQCPPTLPTGVDPADAETDPSKAPEPPRSGVHVVSSPSADAARMDVCDPFFSDGENASEWWHGRLRLTPLGMPVRYDCYMSDLPDDVFQALMKGGPVDDIPASPTDPDAVDLLRAVRTDEAKRLDASFSTLLRQGVITWKDLEAAAACATFAAFHALATRWGTAALSELRYLGGSAPMSLWNGDNELTTYGTFVWERFSRRIAADRGTIRQIIDKGRRTTYTSSMETAPRRAA